MLFKFRNWFRNQNKVLMGTVIGIIAIIVLLILGRNYKNSYKTVAAKDQIKTIYLPDSSLLVMNKGAKIKYSRPFKERRLHVLEGEVYLEVAYHDDISFKLEDKYLSIKLNGDIYCIKRGKKTGDYELIAVDGSARTEIKKASGQSMLTVREGFCMTYNVATKLLQTTETVDNNYLAWKTGQISYVNQPLAMVIPSLEQLFDASIKVSDNNLNYCAVSDTFAFDSLIGVLEKMNNKIDFEVEKKSKSVILVGKGCPMADE